MSGSNPQHPSIRARGPIGYHPRIQARDGGAAGTDAQPRDDCMDEAGQRGEEQRKPESERTALVLQIGFPNGPWVLEK